MLVGPKDYAALGDWNAYCQVCGFKYKASELQKRWDGVYVCKTDWEPRHPQDLIKLPKDIQATPWNSPTPVEQYRTPAPVDPNSL